ncbi:MAG: cell division protein FtsZ [Candidatus Pacebacteria bacterium]|nr:cell division protein FtsZ [Candidatus Paceibacterota bacterium]MDD3434426.1 cell division protein FtsZ [Candidatus Paceibacterota bacterium]
MIKISKKINKNRSKGSQKNTKQSLISSSVPSTHLRKLSNSQETGENYLHKNHSLVIKVLGIGGAGGNIISRIKDKNLSDLEFIAFNTDIQALRATKADKKIQLGKELCRGLGAGMNPERGREAALESSDEIRKALEGADLVFINSGLGGGTGSGATPIITNIAKDLGALVINFVTKPFSFEGEKRQEIAEDAWQKIYNDTDAILTIANDRIFNIIKEETSVLEAFWKIDDVLKEGIKSIVDLIMKPGLINLDYANIRTILTNSGVLLMGISKASGPDRAIKAAQSAITSPLLDISIDGAKKVLFNISGGKDMTLVEINDAARIITQAVAKDAPVIFGTSFNDELKKNELQITVLAGFGEDTEDNFSPLSNFITKIPIEISPLGSKGVTENEGLLDEEASSNDKVEQNNEVMESKNSDFSNEIPAFLRRKKKEK